MTSLLFDFNDVLPGNADAPSYQKDENISMKKYKIGFHADVLTEALFLWRDYTVVSPNGNSIMKRVPVGSLFLTLMKP